MAPLLHHRVNRVNREDQLLVQRGLDFNTPDTRGRTALHGFRYNGRITIKHGRDMAPQLPLTAKTLDALIQQFQQANTKLYGRAMTGECDAFAQALAEHVEQVWPGTGVAPVVVERLRIGAESGEVIEHNPFSHVLLEITLPKGERVLADAGGVDADERWEENWIQPGDDDEVEPCEDTFEYTTITFEDLQIRRSRDRQGPGIDADWVGRFSNALRAQDEPEANPRRRPGRP